MPTTRTLLGATAFSLALAGGGVAGALLGAPAPSGAQDEPSTTTPSDDGEVRPDRPLHQHRGERLAVAAGALGISEDELLTALRDGQSMAQVAEAHGVDVQVVVDALVAEATERLAEIEAALPDRMTELVNREGLPDRGPRRHHGRPGPGAGLGEDAQAAEAS